METTELRPPPQRRPSLNRSPKIVTGYYVGGLYPYIKFGANPPIGGFWANVWKV